MNFASAQTVLTPEELKTAEQILREKPASISQDSFEIIKNKIFSGVPQAEYILVRHSGFGGSYLFL